MKQPLLSGLLLLLSLNAYACLNEISVIPGITYPNNLNGWELWKPTVSKPELYRFIAGNRGSCGDNLVCSDIVIAYLYVSEPEMALKLSSRLVKKFPRRYEVIMTHAAALELNGRFTEALQFIRKGMRIDPDSHKKSEWIHVKILEARIAGGKQNGILGFDFGNGNEPDTPKGIENVRQIVDQVHFQLTERYYFIPQNDQQFGALLHDYANLLYLSNFKTVSRTYYDLAIAYGYGKNNRPNTASLPPLPVKKAETPSYMQKEPTKKPQPPGLSSRRKAAVLIGSGILLLLGFFILRRKRP